MLLALAMLAQPTTDRVLVDRDLRETRVEFVAIDDGAIHYNVNGLSRVEPLGEYLAMTAPDTHLDPHAADPSVLMQVIGVGFDGVTHANSLLELADGQRLLGMLVPPPTEAGESSGDTIEWSSPLFGTLTVSLERVSRIVFDRHSESIVPLGTLTDDVVLLSNGDRLSGFIEQIGSLVQIEAGGDIQEVAIEDVAEIHIANPPAQARGLVAWLADGSIVGLSSVRRTRAGDLTLDPSLDVRSDEGGRPIRPEEFVGALFDAGTLVPLAMLEPSHEAPGSDRRWTESIETGNTETSILRASDILVPGPMEARWSLPRGTRRFAATFELPESCRTWGDCILVVEENHPGDTTREIARARLDARTPTAFVSDVVSTSAYALTIRVEEGAYGPIQDRVIIRRPMLLVGE